MSLPAEHQEPREERLARARQAVQEGNFPLAYAMDDALLEASPNDALVLREYGQARYAEYDDLEGAAQLFERALRAEPDSGPTMLWLADVSSLGYGRGYDGAEPALYREVARLQPREVDAYVGLGLLARTPGGPVPVDEACAGVYHRRRDRSPARRRPRQSGDVALGARAARRGEGSPVRRLAAPQRARPGEPRGNRSSAALDAIERGEAPEGTVRTNDSPRLSWPE